MSVEERPAVSMQPCVFIIILCICAHFSECKCICLWDCNIFSFGVNLPSHMFISAVKKHETDILGLFV